MAVHHSKHTLHLLLVAILIASTKTHPTSVRYCPTKCGNVTIPFPFGTTEACALTSSFFITCNTTLSPPTPFLNINNAPVHVLEISLDGELKISLPVASKCVNKITGESISINNKAFDLTPFQLSSTRNMLRVVGAAAAGVLYSELDESHRSACVSLYYPEGPTSSCSGYYCCQTEIPQKLSSFAYFSEANIFDKNASETDQFDYYPCGYAFLVEKGSFQFPNFITENSIKLNNKKTFPVVVDWAVGYHTCQHAKNSPSYACKSDNSECYNAKGGHGHLCSCSPGFHGNPYILDGCQGTSVSILILLGGTFYVYYTLKKRKFIKLKAQFFQQNGGLFLQQQIAKYKGSTKITKVFTIKELKEASNDFDEGMVLGEGGQGKVYKGIFARNQIVAIKKSKISNSKQVEQFVNEVIMLSQINHRNVVKLIGCCLETEVPLLVYEFIPNGSVYERLHNQSQSLRLTWKIRLRIATETAQALAYLHSAISTPIIHRDVKTANILLDHNLVAKVADFGASRNIPLDQTQVTTLVQGTLGYLDPEYFHTSQLTEKSDVYSFGVVLIELLTGEKVLCFDRPEDDINLAMLFDSSIKEGKLVNIVDKDIIDEANIEQLMEVANIARHCLRLKGEERPTMREVAMELEGICVVEKHRWENTNLCSAESENFLNETQYALDIVDEDGGRGNISSGFDISSQFSTSLNNGR